MELSKLVEILQVQKQTAPVTIRTSTGNTELVQEVIVQTAVDGTISGVVIVTGAIKKP